MNPALVSLRERIARRLPEIVTLRHDLHQHPEIRFEEEWTSNRIAACLAQGGIPHTRGYAKGTGIVAELRGDGPRIVALRADIDALEIQEETGLPYASRIPGRMHACGHDGHTACLLGAALTLAEVRERLPGTVRFIFQPAEEQAAGGRFMVEEGALDEADAVFALHGWPTLPQGQIAVGDGRIMASADFFRIDVAGRGGHGADPRNCIDPVVAAAHITTALQTIVSREVDPWDAAVISVARIHGGSASNIIPSDAWMEGTFRALNPETRARLAEAIERVARHTARALGAEAAVQFGEAGYPPVINDPGMAALVRDTVASEMDPAAIAPVTHPYMYAEDFAFYLQETPGAFIFLGCRRPGDADPHPLHSPRYDFNDDALPTGIEMFCRVAVRALTNPPKRTPDQI